MEIVKVEALGGRSSTGREGGAALEGRSSTGREGETVPEVGFVCLEGKVEFRGWKKMYESNVCIKDV